MSSNDLTVIALTARTALAVVFLLSGLSKARHPKQFIATVVAYRTVPNRVSAAIGAFLIPGELILSGTLFLGILPTASLVAAEGLLAAFLAAVSINIARGRAVACGCFGNGAERISRWTIARLGLLIGLAAVALAPVVVGFGADSMSLEFGVMTASAVTAIVVLAIGNWVLAARDLADLVRSRTSRLAVSSSDGG